MSDQVVAFWMCVVLLCGASLRAGSQPSESPPQESPAQESPAQESPPQESPPQELPPSEDVVPQLYATGFDFAEGPAFDPLSGALYVVNYRGKGHIGRITSAGTASIWCDLNDLAPVEGKRAQANGLKVDFEHRLIVADAGGGRLLRVSADGKSVEVLADRFEGMRFNAINDVALDQNGNIYFTDPGGSSRENPVGAVYRFAIATNRVTRIASGFAFPNGLAVTPDQLSLCLAESQKNRILMLDLTEDGAVNQRVLVDFSRLDKDGDFSTDGMPDGMIFDAAGRLYVAMWTGGVINVVDVPSGKLLRQYDGGGDRVTNCHFFDKFLYTTVAAKEAVFRLKLDVDGFRYTRP